jgi:hypothetical protein
VKRGLVRRLERLEAQAQETAEEVRQTCVPGPLAAALRELWGREGYGARPSLSEMDEACQRWAHKTRPEKLADWPDDELRALVALCDYWKEGGDGEERRPKV